jgi:hypothetical protein
MTATFNNITIMPGHIELAKKVRDTRAVMLSPSHHAENKVVLEKGKLVIILSGKGKLALLADSGNQMPFKSEIAFDEESLPLVVEGSAKIFPDNNEYDCSYKIISDDVISNLEDEDIFVLGRICLTG